MSDETRCQIRCAVCEQWADSRVHFDTAEAFFTSKLIGSTSRCTWCGEITPCTIENVRFDEERDGRKGTYIEAKDTIYGKAKMTVRRSGSPEAQDGATDSDLQLSE